MRKKTSLITFALAVTFAICTNLKAQEPRLAFDMSVPFPVGGNYINVTYNGMFDFGFHYDIFKDQPTKWGASLNAAWLSNDLSRYNVFLFRPGAYVRFDQEALGIVSPFIRIGPAYYAFSNNSESRNVEDIRAFGFNAHVGARFFLTEKVYLIANGEYTRLKYQLTTENPYTSNVYFITLGFGYFF